MIAQTVIDVSPNITTSGCRLEQAVLTLVIYSVTILRMPELVRVYEAWIIILCRYTSELESTLRYVIYVYPIRAKQ